MKGMDTQMKKRLFSILATLTFTALTVIPANITAQAGQWHIQDGRWWYQNEDGSWMHDGWQWIDANGDGLAECYYFDSNGYLLTTSTTPDEFFVNENGAWTVNNVVQTKNMAQTASSSEPVIVNLEVINDVLGVYNVKEQYGRIRVILSDGTILQKDFPPSDVCGWYINAELGDVTGDDEMEIVVNRMCYGSTFTASDTFVYQVRNGELIEHSRITGHSGSKISGNGIMVYETIWDNGKHLEEKHMYWNGSAWVEG